MGAHAVAVAVDLQDGGVVQETVEDRGGDGRVFEDLAPAGDAAVGGQDDRAVLVRTPRRRRSALPDCVETSTLARLSLPSQKEHRGGIADGRDRMGSTCAYELVDRSNS